MGFLLIQALPGAPTRSVAPPPSRGPARLITNDPRLGVRRADVTHWRCRRLADENDRKGTALFWGDDSGVDDLEFEIKDCSAQTIVARWGAGLYIVDYLQVDEKGHRRPRGRSRILRVAGKNATNATNATTKENRVEAAVKPAIAREPAPAPDDNFSKLFSLLAYLEDRNEKTRGAAAAEAEKVRATATAEARYAIERAAAEAKAAQDRYRADLEFQLERERLASKERIAQIEASARHVPARGGPHFDPEVLATRIGEVVGDRIEEALDGLELPTSSAMAPSGQPPPDTATTVINALKETLGPLVALLAQSALPQMPAGGNGNGSPEGGRDPKKEPN